MTHSELLTAWRDRARELEQYAPAAARAFVVAADELEACVRAAEGEALTLAAAAAESGYSADHLRHLVASGAIANAGRRGAPRIRRRDLPKRVGADKSSEYSPTSDAIALASRRRPA